METWFLLYDGQSEDGRGSGQYIGRTTDKEYAKSHYDRVTKNPYSTGNVVVVTDEWARRADQFIDWKAL